MFLKKIKTIIVEDELAAREALKSYIAKYCPQIEIVNEATNCKDAITLINEVKPELVFFGCRNALWKCL